jgi:hypothetical protein
MRDCQEDEPGVGADEDEPIAPVRGARSEVLSGSSKVLRSSGGKKALLGKGLERLEGGRDTYHHRGL